MRYWQYAVYRLHRTGSIDEAIRHLESLCHRSFIPGLAQQRRIAQYSASLREYHRSFASLHHRFIRSSLRVSATLAQNVVSSAEVGRIDMTGPGYAFCLLLKAIGSNWRDDIRMPLIQHLVATELRVPVEMVQAGVYTIEDERHQWHTYSASEVRSARARASQLGAQIVAAARRLRYAL